MNMPAKRPQSAREIAGKVVHDVMTTDQFSNARLSELLDQSRLEARDRNFCAELVYGTLRWARSLEDSLRSALERPGKIPPRVMAHWLVAAYQLQHLSETIPAHAAVNEAVSLVKRLAPGLAGVTNAILRKLGSPKHQMLVFEKSSSLEIAKAFGLPLMLVECIQKELPKIEWEAAAKSFNDRPKTFFRAYQPLSDDDSDLTAHPFVLNSYFSEASQGLLQRLKGAKLVVQDPASQVAALLVAPAQGARVIDMCAAPGMKSLILKELVGKSGSVTAVELDPRKKARMIENMDRLKLPLNIRIADARKLVLDNTRKEAFDAVLLDAPCSGLGTIRRHPEIRLRHSPEKVEQIATLQRELLTSASQLVKKGGVLVYSVCSPLVAEGRDQIEWFLSQHPDFRVENPHDTLSWLPKDAVKNESYIALWPHRHDADAFFAARLVKG